MKFYNVYVTVSNRRAGQYTLSHVMVCGVQSTSCGGAEHACLDLSPIIQNALAFEIGKDTDTEYYADILKDCKEYPFEVFRGKVRDSETLRAHTLEILDEEISADRDEITRLSGEIHEMELQIGKLREAQKRLIEQREMWKLTLQDDQKERDEFAKQYGEFYNYPGIA